MFTKSIAIIVVLCLLTFTSIEGKRPTRQAKSPCGKYEKEIKNSEGKVKCLPNPQSCVGKFVEKASDFAVE